MKTIYVPLVGRLGNLLFQYAYARCWADQNGFELCLHPWVGEIVFEIPCAPRPGSIEPDIVWPEHYRQRQEDLIYTRRQAKQYFRFRPEVIERLKILERNRKPVLLNVREGSDYVGAGFAMVSRQSYLDAARRFGFSEEQCEWESDTSSTRLAGFEGDIWSSGFCTSEVAIPSFYRLMTAPVLFRANSTFSWWAATLGSGRVFSPIIRGLMGGVGPVYCDKFVEGNWPVMVENSPNTDLHLKEA